MIGKRNKESEPEFLGKKPEIKAKQNQSGYINSAICFENLKAKTPFGNQQKCARRKEG